MPLKSTVTALNHNQSIVITVQMEMYMRSQQIHKCVLVTVAALLAVAAFLGGCHGVSW